MTARATTALVPLQPAFSDAERLALAGFLAGYRGLTREAYTLDLRQFTTWCRARSLSLFAVRRADIEGFARDLEARGRARATVTHGCAPSPGSTSTQSKRSCWITPGPRTSDVRGWTMSPMPPRWTATSSARCWSPPGSGRRAEHALISLLALNGLRVSEATGADIEHLGLERGHRTLTITRGKGPVFLASDGRRLDRHGAGRIVRKVARRGGIGKVVTPHTLRHAFITAALDAGVPLRDVQEAASHVDPENHHAAERARGSLVAGTQPTSSPPMSQALPGNRAYRPGNSATGDSNRRAELSTAADTLIAAWQWPTATLTRTRTAVVIGRPTAR